MTSRVLIVDDERLARVALHNLLRVHSDVEVVGEADSVESAAEIIPQLSPDVIFLDVEMPPSSGFDLFGLVDIRARVVFVTAFDRYALRAFEVNALDYLLKPVSPRRLEEAVARVRHSVVAPEPTRGPLLMDDRICLPTSRGARFFLVSEVGVVRASDDYAEIHLRDRTSLLSSLPLAHWESRLPAAFARVHRSAIVNLARVEEIVRVSGDVYSLRVAGYEASIPVRRGLGSSLIDRFRRGLS